MMPSILSASINNQEASKICDPNHSFSPDRWLKVPEAARDIPGIWGNIMTFLGGSRSCIGYRFALYEYVALVRVKFLPVLLIFYLIQNEGFIIHSDSFVHF